MKLTTNDLRALINGGIDMARENITKRQKTFPCLSAKDDFEILEQYFSFSCLLMIEDIINNYQNDIGDIKLLRKTSVIRWWLDELSTDELLERMEVV